MVWVNRIRGIVKRNLHVRWVHDLLLFLPDRVTVQICLVNKLLARVEVSPSANLCIFGPNPKIKGIGTSPIQEIHRPIAIRSEPSGLASPLSSLSIGQRVTDQSEVSPPRHLRNDTPLPPPPQNIPSNDHSTSSTALYSSNPVGASSIQAANQQEPPPQPTQRRLTARMTPPLPSITTINSSAQQNSASSTQQIGKILKI